LFLLILVRGLFYQDKGKVGLENDMDEGPPWMMAHKRQTSEIIENREKQQNTQ
jgi:hypothetical protein